MFLDQTLLNVYTAFTLNQELTTVLSNVTHIILIPDLCLASRAILSSHGTCQESLVKNSFCIAVQALHLQVLTTLGTDHDRVSNILLTTGRCPLRPFSDLHNSISNEIIDAGLTKYDVTLAAF